VQVTACAADTSVALATVGAAIAAVILGVAVVVLNIVRKNLHFTVLGLLLAGGVTLTGALGEIYVVYMNGKVLDLGGWQDRLIYFAIFLAIVTVMYAYVSLCETIEQGITSPATVSTGSPAVAADVVAKAAASAARAASPDAAQADIEKHVSEAVDQALASAPAAAVVLAPSPLFVRKSALL
jgi:hypothetical protein